MKIAIVGQQDFGKSVLEAFLARGDEVAGVFCAPEKPGAKPETKQKEEEMGVIEGTTLTRPNGHYLGLTLQDGKRTLTPMLLVMVAMALRSSTA